MDIKIYTDEIQNMIAKLETYANIQKANKTQTCQIKINEINKQTAKVFNNAIAKIIEDEINIDDHNELEILAKRILEHSKQAYQYAVKKIGEISADNKDFTDEVKAYINSAETQKMINDAKKATIKVAEKGLDLLKKTLKPND